MANINLRDFPDDLHRRVKAQAALMGISLRDFIIQVLSEFLEKEGEFKAVSERAKK